MLGIVVEKCQEGKSKLAPTLDGQVFLQTVGADDREENMQRIRRKHTSAALN